MKIGLVYPQYENYPKWDWVRDAFMARGHQVAVIRSLDVLKRADESADLILFAQYGAGLPDAASFGRKHSALWITWQFDTFMLQMGLPLREQTAIWTRCYNASIPTPQLTMLRAMDVVLCKDREAIPEMDAMGIRGVWCDQACPSNMPQVQCDPEPKWDVLIYGASEPPWVERKQDVRAIIEGGLSVAWAGLWGDALPPGVEGIEHTPPLKLPELAAKAAITLCVDFRSDLDGYWSDRLWLATGMGAYALRKKSPGLPTGGETRVYDMYSGRDDLLEIANRMKNLPSERLEIGAAAREWVMREHTYENRVDWITSKVETWNLQRKESAGCVREQELLSV